MLLNKLHILILYFQNSFLNTFLFLLHLQIYIKYQLQTNYKFYICQIYQLISNTLIYFIQLKIRVFFLKNICQKFKMPKHDFSKYHSNICSNKQIGNIFMIYLDNENNHWPAKLIDDYSSKFVSNHKLNLKRSFLLYSVVDNKGERKKITLDLSSIPKQHLIPFESVYAQAVQGKNKNCKQNKKLQIAIKQAVKEYQSTLKQGRVYSQFLKQSKRIKNRGVLSSPQSLKSDQSSKTCFVNNSKKTKKQINNTKSSISNNSNYKEQDFSLNSCETNRQSSKGSQKTLRSKTRKNNLYLVNNQLDKSISSISQKSGNNYKNLSINTNKQNKNNNKKRNLSKLYYKNTQISFDSQINDQVKKKRKTTNERDYEVVSNTRAIKNKQKNIGTLKLIPRTYAAQIKKENYTKKLIEKENLKQEREKFCKSQMTKQIQIQQLKQSKKYQKKQEKQSEQKKKMLEYVKYTTKGQDDDKLALKRIESKLFQLIKCNVKSQQNQGSSKNKSVFYPSENAKINKKIKITKKQKTDVYVTNSIGLKNKKIHCESQQVQNKKIMIKNKAQKNQNNKNQTLFLNNVKSIMLNNNSKRSKSQKKYKETQQDKEENSKKVQPIQNKKQKTNTKNESKKGRKSQKKKDCKQDETRPKVQMDEKNYSKDKVPKNRQQSKLQTNKLEEKYKISTISYIKNSNKKERTSLKYQRQTQINPNLSVESIKQKQKQCIELKEIQSNHLVLEQKKKNYKIPQEQNPQNSNVINNIHSVDTDYEKISLLELNIKFHQQIIDFTKPIRIPFSMINMKIRQNIKEQLPYFKFIDQQQKQNGQFNWQKSIKDQVIKQNSYFQEKPEFGTFLANVVSCLDSKQKDKILSTYESIQSQKLLYSKLINQGGKYQEQKVQQWQLQQMRQEVIRQFEELIQLI